MKWLCKLMTGIFIKEKSHNLSWIIGKKSEQLTSRNSKTRPLLFPFQFSWRGRNYKWLWRNNEQMVLKSHHLYPGRLHGSASPTLMLAELSCQYTCLEKERVSLKINCHYYFFRCKRKGKEKTVITRQVNVINKNSIPLRSN